MMVEIGGKEEEAAARAAAEAQEAQEARGRKKEPTGKRGVGGDRGEQYRMWDPGGISCA